MLLSQTAEYALRAVLHLAAQPFERTVRVPELAEATGVPRNYLSKTLHLLVRAGVLRSTRGPTGGFRLAGAAAGLTLKEVVAPFTGPDTRRCLMHDRPCGGPSPCAVHTRWAPVARQLDAFFCTTTVADITRVGVAPTDLPLPEAVLPPADPTAGGAGGAAGLPLHLHQSVHDGGLLS